MTKPRRITQDDLAEHSDMLNHLDQANVLAAMRLVPAAAGISDSDLLALASAVLLDQRFQGYGTTWVGAIGPGTELATDRDR